MATKKLNKKYVREAIKERVERQNGGRGLNEFGFHRLPEWHFYCRDNDIRVDLDKGVVTMRGEVVAKLTRKWSQRKVNLCYRELVPTVAWV